MNKLHANLSGIPDGIYQDKDFEIVAYHSDGAISKSGLGVFSEYSPLHYESWRAAPSPDKVHLRKGSLAHYLILQPDEFDKLVVVPPPGVTAKNGAWSGNKFYEWKNERLADLPESLIVKPKEKDAAYHMRDEIFKHDIAKQLLTLGVSEVSGVLTLPSGVRVKCRPDHWPVHEICADLKTARTAHPEKFGSQSYYYHYHWSGFMCTWILSKLSGKPVRDYYFVVVESDAPYDVTVHKMGPESMELARKEVKYWLKKFEECVLVNEWPGYPKEVLSLKLPRSAYRYNKVLAEMDDEPEQLDDYFSNGAQAMVGF